MQYLFFESSQYGARVGQDSIMVGGFTEPLELRISGTVRGNVVSEGEPISDDGVRWVQRLTFEFNEIETIFIKPNEDRSVITKITVEAA